MQYQLPTGKVIFITIEQYLSMTDNDIQYLISTNAGESIHNPFNKSALDENTSEKQEKLYDFSFIESDEETPKEISFEDLTQDDLDKIDSLDM
jgi:hypothetical protein